jgi:hypothetical protein
VASSAESEATTAVKTTQQNATTEVQQVYTLGMDSPDLAVQEGQHIECVATGRFTWTQLGCTGSSMVLMHELLQAACCCSFVTHHILPPCKPAALLDDLL